MTDVRSFFEKKYLGAWDIPEGKDVILVIDRCEGAVIKGTSGDEKKAPLLYFSNTKSGKPMVLNVTNAKTLIKLHGRHIEQWKGKRISLFATTVTAFGEEMEALRIRPTAPAEKAAGTKQAALREPGDDSDELRPGA